MANLRRIPYTKPVPADAEIIQCKNGPHARFKDKKGKTVLAPLTKDGKRIRLLSRKWYGEYLDSDGKPRSVPLSTNKTAAQTMLGKLVEKAEAGRCGLTDPFEEHRQRPLQEHLEDYRRELEARDNAPRYVALVISRLRALFDGCGFRFTTDLSASRAMDWLADLRRRGEARAALPEGQDLFAAREVAALLGITLQSLGEAARRLNLELVEQGRRRLYPRAAVEALQDKRAQGVSVQTTNYYRSHLKSFCHWLVQDRRMGENPVAHLEAGNVGVDRRHDRRELEAEDLRGLLAATRGSRRVFRGLTGEDRFALYATACGTGFRAGALASLTPESFDLAGDPATVTLAARRNKSRKLKVQPLPADVAELLRDYLKGRPPGQPVWGGTWGKAGKAAQMLRLDLEAAGIPYAVEGPDGPLYVDFHALRHTYLTMGGRAGIDLRTLQELAGHSSPALTARYSHRRLYDLAGAVEKLPSLLPQEPTSLRATGTLGREPAESLRPACAGSDAACGSVRPGDSPGGKGGEAGSESQILMLQGFDSCCDPMRPDDGKEAPPGFEPGMADLQSAALPLG